MERFNHLKIKELKLIKAKIVSEIERIQKKFQETTEALPTVDNSRNEADMALSDYANAQMYRLQSREGYYLKKLEHATKKLDEKDFGCCDECGVEISFTRLIARPTANMCIHCKEESEREEKVSLPSNTTFGYTNSVSL